MGQFDRPPTAAGHADYQYGVPLSRSASEGGEEEHHRRILRPVLDFLVLAAALLPLKLWWNLADEQCWDPSSYKATELTLLRVTRGVWIAWLTHAAGLLDEALRVFLGIRLTMGLGSPTSVDKTYTKMSRRAEIVAEVGQTAVIFRSLSPSFCLCTALHAARYVRVAVGCCCLVPSLALSLGMI